MNQPAGRTPPKIEVVGIRSKLLGKEIYYSVLVPDAIKPSIAPVGVLYLLHGLFGSHENWASNTHILEHAGEHNFTIVCPDAGDGWYTDNPAILNYNYESFFFDEIVPHAEERFHAGGSRDRRAVAGISMGGYGGFKFAFRRPDMFCFAASMSGAFHAAEIVSDGEEKRREVVPSIEHVFGEDKVLREANSLPKIASEFPENRISELPPFYFDCGTADEFFPANVRFSALLESRGIAHRFEKRAGGHGWAYWDANLRHIIQLTGARLNRESSG